MMKGNPEKMIKVKRLFNRIYDIEESQVVAGGGNNLMNDAGRIIINSQYLKPFINRKARVIVYVEC